MRELSVVEQRYQAVPPVIGDGETVTEVAARLEVRRQTVQLPEDAARLQAPWRTAVRVPGRLRALIGRRGAVGPRLGTRAPGSASCRRRRAVAPRVAVAV